MLLTLLASLVITQFFNPLFANFEQQLYLKRALQGTQLAQASYQPFRVNENNLGPKLSSRASVVVDQATRAVLWSQGLHERYPIASITKLMTALVFLETEPDLSRSFTLNGTDLAGAGVRYIDSGESVRLKDLLFVSLIASDNNAAQSLVRASGLENQQFIDRMNSKARELGMLNSNFVEPTGLAFANISSAQDVVLLLEAALQDELIADIVKRPVYEFTALSGQQHKIFSTNRLLGSYLDVIGGKTGFNSEAQFNLATAVRGDQAQVLLIVNLGSAGPEARFRDVKAMADWSFRNYIWP